MEVALGKGKRGVGRGKWGERGVGRYEWVCGVESGQWGEGNGECGQLSGEKCLWRDAWGESGEGSAECIEGC